MEMFEKVAYLKGLAEGLALDTETKEGKLIAAIIDVLDDMCEELAAMQEELFDMEDGLDAVSDDLSEVEEVLYELIEDEEDDEDELEAGEIICPNCGAKLEFDLSDLAAECDEEDED